MTNLGTTAGKPVGSRVVLRCELWGGEDVGDRPEPGIYLVSSARSAYLIIHASKRAGARSWRLVCRKVHPTEIPRDADVRHWTWTPRVR